MTSTSTRLRPWQILAATVLLTGAALLAYWPALTGGFLWDDDTLVTDSTLVKAPDGLYRMKDARSARIRSPQQKCAV